MSPIRNGLSAVTLLLALTLSACGGVRGANPLPEAPPATAESFGEPVPLSMTVKTPTVTSNTAGIAANLAGQQLSNGAILYTSTVVSPYFANVAAIGAVHGGLDLVNVQNYMAWYIAQSAQPNPWAIPGAITDYNVTSTGALVSAGTADSVDSYAATFITLAAAAYNSNNPELKAYVVANRAAIERIASAIDAVSDTDGLTFALPTYKMKYVMDNSEVYHGLVDLAMLRAQAYGDLAGAAQASAHALLIQTAIQTKFWRPGKSEFAIAIDAYGTKTLPAAGDWQDGAAQLFPILHGVVAPTSTQAVTAYTRFSAAFPGWPQLKKPDDYPWVSVAFVALLMNDTARANTYASAVSAKYAPHYKYPWYCAESGWYVRLLNGLTAPQTLASL
jgi:hypothetical protein